MLKQTKGTFNFQDLREEGDKPEYDETVDDMGLPPTVAARAETDQEAGRPEDAAPATPAAEEQSPDSFMPDSPEEPPTAPVDAHAEAPAAASPASEPTRAYIEQLAKRSVEANDRLD
eukprot:4999614-Pyramimonas_sp.AAC.1